MLLQDKYEEAKKKTLALKEIFGRNNFFLEVQDHGILDQKRIINDLIRLSEQTDVLLVVTNDIHYIDREDAPVHDALLCIQTGKTIDDENRMKFQTSEFYLKSSEEMEAFFHIFQKLLKIQFELPIVQCKADFDTLHLPSFKVPEGFTQDEYLEKLCYEGLRKRYSKITPK